MNAGDIYGISLNPVGVSRTSIMHLVRGYRIPDISVFTLAYAVNCYYVPKRFNLVEACPVREHLGGKNVMD